MSSSSSKSNNSLADEVLTTDSSVATFVSSLVFNSGLTLIIYALLAFVLTRLPSVYTPRAKYSLPDRRTEIPSSGHNILKFFYTLCTLPTSEFVRQAGLDAFALDEYLHISALLFTGFSLFALPILLPLNSVGQKSKSLGLNKFDLGNVTSTQRLWAHAFLAVIFTLVTIYGFYRALSRVCSYRFDILTSPAYADSSSAKTVIIKGVPSSFLQEEARIVQVFERYGPIERITFVPKASEVKELVKLAEQRNEVALKLEDQLCRQLTTVGKEETAKIEELEAKTIELNQQVEQLKQTTLGGLSNGTLAREDFIFVRFAEAASAQTVPQIVRGIGPWRFCEAWTNIEPEDLIWENLAISSPQKWIRKIISWLICLGLVIVWSVLVTFISAISSLSNLTKLLPFLKKLNSLPSSIVGVIQGVIPAVAVAILMALLPVILTALCKFEGHPSNSKVQLSLMHKHFIFLVVNVLIVSAFANGIFKSLQQLIDNPASAINILATQMPKASVFFITYVLLQALTGISQQLLNLPKLCLQWLFIRMAHTPRAKWNAYAELEPVAWGIVFPVNVLIFAIGMTFSVISPLILPFTALCFWLSIPAYRYTFLYLSDSRSVLHGRAFLLALYHTFASLYIFLLTMFGIFLLKNTVGPAMVVLVGILITATANRFFIKQCSGLVRRIPAEAFATEAPPPSHPAAGTAMEMEEDPYLPPSIKPTCPTLWFPSDQQGRLATELDKLRQANIPVTEEGAQLLPISTNKNSIIIDPERVPAAVLESD